MDEKKKCKTILLDDEPVKIDGFKTEKETGPHQKVANAITELIKTPDEKEKGSAIALLGPWGSGKSSVVKMIKEGLKDKNTIVFEYDAWAFGKDPLRKSFLIKLIEKLQGNISNNKYWLEKKKDLESKTKKRNKFEFKVVKILAGFLIAGISGIGGAVFSQVLKVEDVNFGIFALAILIILAIIILFLWEYFPNKFSATLDSFVEEAKDPTAYEFNKYFHDLLRAYHRNKSLCGNEKKLLIVIDNLDRIEKKAALQLWSILSAFFQKDNDSDTKHLINFWLLVPFDEDSADKIWPTEEGEKNLSQSFIDKTFQIKFHVPPLVLTDWRQYMEKLFKEALPDHFPLSMDDDKKTEMSEVLQIYNLMRNNQDYDPTPRAIKKFVNSVGAFHRIWKDEIDLKYMAVYVLKRDETLCPATKRKEDKKDTTDKKHEMICLDKWMKEEGAKIDPPVVHFLDPHYANFLAMLHYGVSKDRSSHILLKKPILDALENKNTEKLVKLDESYGFKDVCISVTMNEYSKWVYPNDSEQLTPVTLALSNFLKNHKQFKENWEDELDSEWESVFKTLYEALAKVYNWYHFDEDCGIAVSTIVRINKRNINHDINASFIKQLLQFSPTLSKKTNTENIEKWQSGVEIIFNTLENLGENNDIKENFKIADNFKDYIEILNRSENENLPNIITKYCLPSFDIQELNNELLNEYKNDKMDINISNAIKIIIETDLEINYQEIEKYIQNQFTGDIYSDQSFNVEYFTTGMETLFSLAWLKSSENAENILKVISSDLHIFHHFYYVKNPNTKDSPLKTLAKAICVFTAQLYYSRMVNLTNVSDSKYVHDGLDYYNKIIKQDDFEPETIESVSSLIIKYEKLSQLLDIHQQHDYKLRIISRILISIYSKNPNYELSVKCLNSHYNFISKNLEKKKMSGIIRNQINNNNIVGELGDAFDLTSVELYLMYLKKYKKNEISQKEEFENAIVNFLGSISLQWHNQSLSNGKLFSLLMYLNDCGHKHFLGESFGEALFEHADAYLTKNLQIEQPDNWDKVINCMDKKVALDILKKLFVLISTSDSQYINRIIKLYGNAFIANQILEENTEELELLLKSISEKLLEPNPKNIKYLIFLEKATKESKKTQSKVKKWCSKTLTEIYPGNVKEYRDIIESISKSSKISLI